MFAPLFSLRLDVVVEFQQPQKKPLLLFLEHVHETDNVFDLQVEVGYCSYCYVRTYRPLLIIIYYMGCNSRTVIVCIDLSTVSLSQVIFCVLLSMKRTSWLHSN